MNEPTYTLEEARRELDRIHCQHTGHDFQIMLATGHADPQFITCNRCGRQWQIAKDNA